MFCPPKVLPKRPRHRSVAADPSGGTGSAAGAHRAKPRGGEAPAAPVASAARVKQEGFGECRFRRVGGWTSDGLK